MDWKIAVNPSAAWSNSFLLLRLETWPVGLAPSRKRGPLHELTVLSNLRGTCQAHS